MCTMNFLHRSSLKLVALFTPKFSSQFPFLPLLVSTQYPSLIDWAYI